MTLCTCAVRGVRTLDKRISGVLKSMESMWDTRRRSRRLHDTSLATVDAQQAVFGASSHDADRSVEGFTYVPRDSEGYGLSCKHVRVRKGCAHCSRLAKQQRKTRLALGFVDRVSKTW